MAKSTQERSAKSTAAAKEKGEEDLRHKVRPGTRQKLAELMQWSGVAQISEAVQLLIINAHALGPDGAAELLKIPRHEIVIDENVARNIYRLGATEAKALDRQDAD